MGMPQICQPVKKTVKGKSGISQRYGVGLSQKIFKFLLSLVILFLITSCGTDSRSLSADTIKIYSGSYGYDVAYRVEGSKIYFGSYGYDVAYRIDGNKIYSGAYGYDVAYRVDGSKIYSGSYGYNVAYRIDGDKIYSGSYGYTIAYRIEK
jgi:hypothetical protein